MKPLDEILGTPANVRLLPVLALRRTPLTAGEPAKRAALGRTSIYPALRQLERAGVLEFIGAGSQRLVQLRDRHPLSRMLRELFRTETRRFEALTVALRELFSDLPHRPLPAWVDEPAGDAQGVETLTLHVVARPEELQHVLDYLNEHLVDVERKHDVQLAVHGLTRSELDTLHDTSRSVLGAVVLIAGVPPVALRARSRSAATDSTLVSHDVHDARSRKLALAIAAKIKRDPGLIAIAEDRIKRRALQASPRERRELLEWLRILSAMPAARLQRFLAEDSERAVRLRRTLPALNLLSPAEREAVIPERNGRRRNSRCYAAMTRAELEHAIRAACDVSGDDEVYVFGSQAILGQYPEAPESLRQSAEADIAPVNAVGVPRLSVTAWTNVLTARFR